MSTIKDPASRPPPPRNPLTAPPRRRGFNTAAIVRVLARQKLEAAYAEIAALTPTELAEIEADPALKRTYEEYCAYWREVQSFVDRHPHPASATDAERRVIIDKYRALKLSEAN